MAGCRTTASETLMASPPFNINENLPGDTDIVSQHPANARQMRDIVESWLRVNHDTNGNHFRIDLPRGASPGTPAALTDVLYMTTSGKLKIVHPDATEEYVGVAPGIVNYTAGALDTGYLAADGSAVNRVTFADLFVKIGIQYGAGDGSLTFNLPNVTGRVLVGIDGGFAVLSASAYAAANALGGIGGTNYFDGILQTDLPNVQIGMNGSLTVLSSATDIVRAPFGFSNAGFTSGAGGPVQYLNTQSNLAQQIASATSSFPSLFTNSLNGAVTQTKLNRLQPSIILRPQIKY